MQIKRKPTAIALAGAYAVWTIFLQPIWNLNLERLAEREQIDKTLAGGGMMDSLKAAADFVPNSFGLGFVVGALIFAYWDLITAAFKRWVLRRPVVYDLRAWVGSIVPYLELRESGGIKLRISVVNVGAEAFRVSRIEGYIDLKYETGDAKRKTINLPAPALEADADGHRLVPHGHLYDIYLLQAIPAAVAASMPDTFQWSPYPNFGFDNLSILLTTADGKFTKRLKLWESMRVTAGENELRAVETFRIFKSEAERLAFNDSIQKVARRFGVPR